MGGSYAVTGLPQPIGSATYNANNQLTQWGDYSLYYDQNGNMTSDGSNSYTWNARNQLASMNFGTNTFGYDGYGRRYTSSISSTSINYLYDGANVVQELNGSTPTANILGGLGIDENFTRTDSTWTANYLTDALGSTVGLADSSGTVQTGYAYEPFGNTTVSGTSTTPYQYTGQVNDGTGLYFYRARYYSPTLQRFVSEDPIGMAGSGPNLYAYVSNNPLNFNDPLGLDKRSGGPGGNGAGGGNGSGGNPNIALAADVIGVAGTVSKNLPLGVASTIISVANDSSPANIAINGLGLVPGLDVPVTFGSAAYDGSKFVTNQVLAPIFNAAPTQTIDDGYGHIIPNPALQNDEGDPLY